MGRTNNSNSTNGKSREREKKTLQLSTLTICVNHNLVVKLFFSLFHICTESARKSQLKIRRKRERGKKSKNKNGFYWFSLETESPDIGSFLLIYILHSIAHLSLFFPERPHCSIFFFCCFRYLYFDFFSLIQ